MAGSGNGEIFKRIEKLSTRVSADINYGNHMATHMSTLNLLYLGLGLLFMGAGEISLSNASEKDVAILFCSFFPKFPLEISDNRSHLQALRHLWAICAENRCFVARDAVTHKIIFTPIVVDYKDPEFDSQPFLAPCLLPPFHSIKSIRSCSPRYWPRSVSPPKAKQLYSSTYFFQKKMGFLEYEVVYTFITYRIKKGSKASKFRMTYLIIA